ncbi:MAG: hypothetical protein H0T70_03960 [Acidimicrobiia bacterium]|nr:hypothetical protein [Acidimicrobiia bacterium]
MTTRPKVTVRVDDDGVMRVDVGVEGERDPTHLVAETRDDDVTPFGDEEFKARQHIRWSG